MPQITEFLGLPQIEGPYAFRYAEVMVKLPTDPVAMFTPVGDCDDFEFNPNPTIAKRFTKRRSISTLAATAAVKFEGGVSFKAMQWGNIMKTVAALGDAVSLVQAAVPDGSFTTHARLGRLQFPGYRISAPTIATTGGGPIDYVLGPPGVGHFLLDDPDGGWATVHTLPDGVAVDDEVTVGFVAGAVLGAAGFVKNNLLTKSFIQVSLAVRELANLGPQEQLFFPTVNLTPKSGTKWVGGDDFEGVEVQGDVLDAGQGFGYRVDVPNT